MKKSLEEALSEKQKQRKENAARPVAEKLRMLDRMLERSKQLRRSKTEGSGPRNLE